jgi:methyl-accepting chemotaxis protein
VIDELASVLEESADKARQIAGAASQQAIGIAQISDAIGNVAKGGQDSVAGVRQLEQAVSSLSALGAQMRNLTARYQL